MAVNQYDSELKHRNPVDVPYECFVHYRTGLPPTRLHANWKGPMRVIKGLNSRYTLLDLITGKEKDYHVSDMKPFVFDSALVDPLDIARRSNGIFHRENFPSSRKIESSEITPTFR